MITAWILMTYVSYHSGFQYSPPVATQAACEAIKDAMLKGGIKHGIATCVKVEIHK